MQTPRNYLLRGPSYSQFCPKIRCHGNGGWQGKNFNDTVKLADPENHTLEQKLQLYLIHSRSYDSLKHCLILLIGAIVIFHIFVKKLVKMLNLNFVTSKRHFLARNRVI